MFESPLYPVEQPMKGGLSRKIVIDVTKSAPSFSGPGSTLAGALKKVLSAIGSRQNAHILDFGAGKLRNALYLLEEGYRVTAVEYEQLFRDSGQAGSALVQAHRYRARFHTLIYPHQFKTDDTRFDLILLINVLNIMPVPAERLLVLQYCHDKLATGGHLLWYTQRGDPSYVPKLIPQNQVGDGYFMGVTHKYKTFYREFTVADIDAMLASTGFEFLNPVAASARNQARLYRRGAATPLRETLTAGAIKKAGVINTAIPLPTSPKPVITRSTDDSKGNPDPTQLRPAALFARQLQKLPTGPQSARRYQELVKAILQCLFPHELEHFKLEQRSQRGIKRLDIRARNHSRASTGGFFYALREDWDLKCPIIVIECKNYREDVANPAVDQLSAQLIPRIGVVGILACRRLQNKRRALDRARQVYSNDHKVILVLTDDDLLVLLGYRQQNDDKSIEGHMDALLQSVLDG